MAQTAHTPRTLRDVEAVLKELRKGYTPRSACGAVGLPHRTFMNWVAENRDKYEDAVHAGLRVDEEALRKAYEDNPNLRHQYLIRRNRDLMPSQQVEVSGAGGGPVQVAVAADPEKLRATAAAIAALPAAVDADGEADGGEA